MITILAIYLTIGWLMATCVVSIKLFPHIWKVETQELQEAVDRIKEASVGYCIMMFIIILCLWFPILIMCKGKVND
jgi:hypothetical protein